MLSPAEVLTSGATLAAARGVTTVAPAAWTRGHHRVVDAWSAADPSSPAGKAALSAVRMAAAAVPGARVGGAPAQDDDFIHALYGRNLIVIIAAIVVVSLVLLTRALRSVWLPVKALLLNLVSLAAAFGVLTFVWQEGHGTTALFSSPATGAITLWVPLAVFALLFGLSMDYEVFILTRINEEYADGHDTGDAVIRGIGHTGARHLWRPHSLPGLHRARRRSRDRRQNPLHGPGRRHHHRRHTHPRHPRPRPGRPPRPPQLVAPPPRRAPPARRTADHGASPVPGNGPRSIAGQSRVPAGRPARMTGTPGR